jgi:hypothetical protein
MKRYGEMNGAIYRNYGYDPYNMAIKYKISFDGNVYYAYINTYTELKTAIAQITGYQDEED